MTFDFVSGNFALDLVGTLKWRRDVSPEELLPEPADLERWFEEADGLPGDVRIDAASHSSALALREAVYALATDRVKGRRLDPAALKVLNEAATHAGLRLRLDADGQLTRFGDARAALSDVARSAVAVLGDPDACLKECGRASCTRIYLDRSRGTRRTWCGMDECGNRVKAAAYRSRKRQAAESGR